MAPVPEHQGTTSARRLRVLVTDPIIARWSAVLTSGAPDHDWVFLTDANGEGDEEAQRAAVADCDVLICSRLTAEVAPHVGATLVQVTGAGLDRVAVDALPAGTEVTTTAHHERSIAEHASEVRIAVCSGRIGVDTELMRALPALEAIINFGVGYDATDVAQAAERGIPLSNTPDVLNDCVADTALGLYLDTLRQVSAADRFLCAGRWAAGEGFPLSARSPATPTTPPCAISPRPWTSSWSPPPEDRTAPGSWAPPNSSPSARRGTSSTSPAAPWWMRTPS